MADNTEVNIDHRLPAERWYDDWENIDSFDISLQCWQARDHFDYYRNVVKIERQTENRYKIRYFISEMMDSDQTLEMNTVMNFNSPEDAMTYAEERISHFGYKKFTEKHRNLL